MFVQNLNRIISKPNDTPWQILYCTSDCIPVDLMFEENFHTNTQVWNVMSHRNDCRQRWAIWVTYQCHNSNPYQVRDISHQEVQGPIHLVYELCRQPTDRKSKAAAPWRFVVVEPNHSWWWPFKSPTNRKEARISSVCTESLMLVNNQKSGHLGQGWGKDWTHKGSVSHHTPLKTSISNNHTQIWVGEMLVNHFVRTQPSLEHEASCPGTTRQEQTGINPAGNCYIAHYTCCLKVMV